MGAIGSTICHSSRIICGLGEMLLKDVDEGVCARFPVGESGRVDTNHPAFIYGHLALYPSRVVQTLGLEGNPLSPPDGYEELFAPGVSCQDDTDGSIYPVFGNIRAAFTDLHAKCHDLIEGLPDASFEAETPMERYRERFPKVADAVNFLMNDHLAFHLGQMSAWRRMFGLGHAM